MGAPKCLNGPLQPCPLSDPVRMVRHVEQAAARRLPPTGSAAPRKSLPLLRQEEALTWGAMTSPIHPLLTLWNPSYAADAMDAHLAVFLDWAGRWRRGEAPEHLPQQAPGELEHMPHYYRSQFADFWFRLWDIRRLVADDTPAVIEELKRLRNIRYHDRPVSLYGGMVDLPLIVTRPDEVSWFPGLPTRRLRNHPAGSQHVGVGELACGQQFRRDPEPAVNPPVQILVVPLVGEGHPQT